MNQLFAGGIALLIALVIWSSGKKSKAITFESKNKDSLSNLGKEDISLVKTTEKPIKKPYLGSKTQEIVFKSPENPRDKMILKQKLAKLIIGSPEDRLYAVEIASKWNSQESIPFIRKGLKDSDSRVVIVAASAINRFKGKKAPIKRDSQTISPPLNVSRMR